MEAPAAETSQGEGNQSKASGNHKAEDDTEGDESEYEYEDEEDAAFAGFLVDHSSLVMASSKPGESPERLAKKSCKADAPDMSLSVDTNVNSEVMSVAPTVAVKPKWREPSRQAVSMSLRAEKEKTGSKRRLAQDLYRIMNQDTEEAGFSIGPKSEDSMDHWVIKLFKFDPDSNLAKDMLVLGYDFIELEMSFPDQYPFEPPFVRVVRPRFKKQTGFVMNGALCMELLTNVR